MCIRLWRWTTFPDSPNCCKEGLRLTWCKISSNEWSLNSLDVRTAFLQEKLIEWTVYVRPPKEAQTNKVWKLRKWVYGLSDTNRYWYLKWREEPIKLGAKYTSTRKQVHRLKISDLISANKIVKFVKNTPTYIRIPALYFESLYIKLFPDACFNNLQNGGRRFLRFPKWQIQQHSIYRLEINQIKACCSISTCSWNSSSLRWLWYVLLHSVTCQRNDIPQTL